MKFLKLASRRFAIAGEICSAAYYIDTSMETIIGNARGDFRLEHFERDHVAGICENQLLPQSPRGLHRKRDLAASHFLPTLTDKQGVFHEPAAW